MEIVTLNNFLLTASSGQLEPGDLYRVGEKFPYTLFLAIDNSHYELQPRKYISTLSQIGVLAPTANVLSDSIGNLVWSYEAVGTYLLTGAKAFPIGKTFPLSAGIIDLAGNRITAEWVDENSIRVKTYAAVDTTVFANGVLNNHEFKILIYA